MFITNFSLNSHIQNIFLVILIVFGVALLSCFLGLIMFKDIEYLPFTLLFCVASFIVLPLALKPNEYKLTIAYVNVNDDNKTMTKDVAINTLLNDGIYPKYNLKYKIEKETFKLTKEEYEKLSEIYYDDLNNRR